MPKKALLQKECFKFFLPSFAGITPSRFIGSPAPISYPSDNSPIASYNCLPPLYLLGVYVSEIGAGFSASDPPNIRPLAPLAYSNFTYVF
jgi:hypothetical protein